MKRLFKWLLILIAIAVGAVILFFGVGWATVDQSAQYGITWSNTYASSLGIDPWRGLEATLSDLNVKLVRIPAYWTDIEPTKGRFDWTTLDRQLALLDRYHAKAYIVVGLKQPRWPEFWKPEWVKALSAEDEEKEQLAYVAAVVKRYKNHPALAGWQVENEPAFGWSFGVGSLQPHAFVQKEIALVKQLDPQRFVYTTESGELSTWVAFRDDVTTIGTSVYRVVVNPWLGTVRYWFVPPWVYARKALLVSPWTKHVFVSEFQMEPWANDALQNLTPEEQFRTFDVKQMQNNFWFAERMHLSPILFWGAEWWYWMKVKLNHPEFWEQAKTFFAEHG